MHRESPREELAGGGDAEVVGTVMVRDVVTRQVVAHFRAHTAPLLLLQWDGSGTLLVTASVHGHNINIFQVAPYPPGCGTHEAWHACTIICPAPTRKGREHADTGCVT